MCRSMTDILRLASVFYDAVWDFSTRVILLTDHFKEDSGYGVDPRNMLQDFKALALPFLDLDGSQVPACVTTLFDQIDETVRHELFPGYDVLVEEWDELLARQSELTRDDILGFAERIVFWVNHAEMYIIAQTADLIHELKSQSQPKPH